jgi:hypothetical protein
MKKMIGMAAVSVMEGATQERFAIDATWVANEYMWMVAAVSFALCAVVLDVFVLGHEVRTFQSFDSYVDDLLAGNGTRVRRDRVRGEF